MSQKYARLLTDQDLVEHFLVNVLDFDLSTCDKNIIYNIIEGEKGLIDLDIHAQTLNSTKYRDRDYKEDKKRWGLRNEIINELLEMNRPENDDDITLGSGGALPKSGLKTDKQAYILIGLPASGKSGVANKISENNNAIILDSDYAKRKLPEFSNYKWGATVVHEESSQIVFGFKEKDKNIKSVYDVAISKGYNMVIPKIGQDANSIIALAEVLKKIGYKVHLTLISLLKREATIRAIYRYNESKRYVPLGLIFDGYGNDPCLTYYLIKNKMPDLFESYGAISTNIEKGGNPFTVDIKGENPANVYEIKENVLI